MNTAGKAGRGGKGKPRTIEPQWPINRTKYVTVLACSPNCFTCQKHVAKLGPCPGRSNGIGEKFSAKHLSSCHSKRQAEWDRIRAVLDTMKTYCEQCICYTPVKVDTPWPTGTDCPGAGLRYDFQVDPPSIGQMERCFLRKTSSREPVAGSRERRKAS